MLIIREKMSTAKHKGTVPSNQTNLMSEKT